MALDAYLTQTRQLLQIPEAPASLYPETDLTDFINRARKQVAGDGECIRILGTLALVSPTQRYLFSAINLGSSVSTGVSGVINARMISVNVTGGRRMLNAWPWEYFNQFYYSQPTQTSARPTDWAQYAQGALGSLYFSPSPDQSYTVNIDTVCFPVDLEDDTTAEAIPFPWTDCVCYFAAYLALLSAQSAQRQADADRMFARYDEFKDRARRYSTSQVLPFQYEHSGARIPVVPAGVEPPKIGPG